MAAAIPAGPLTDQFTTIRRADRHRDWNEFLPMSNPSLATKVQFVKTIEHPRRKRRARGSTSSPFALVDIVVLPNVPNRLTTFVWSSLRLFLVTAPTSARLRATR
jgi:hypothetical protein